MAGKHSTKTIPLRKRDIKKDIQKGHKVTRRKESHADLGITSLVSHEEQHLLECTSQKIYKKL